MNGIHRIVGPTILLRSGNYFDFEDPENSVITIDDIATGLSHLCRFTGQCHSFYSVAEHSVLVSRMVPPQDAFAALMHDAAEAVMGDISCPITSALNAGSRRRSSPASACRPRCPPASRPPICKYWPSNSVRPC